MNKKILAVAIASAFAAPLAAQADEGNVTLYGSANVAFEQIDAGNFHNGLGDEVGGDRSTSEINTNQSVLGVQGYEALGNGLRAVFHFDALLNLDSGAGDGTVRDASGTAIGTGSGSGFFGGGRDGWVGLAGGFGTVALGFQGRPWKTSTNNLDVFGSTIADYSSILGTIPIAVSRNVNGTVNTTTAAFFDSGCGNAAIYFAPNWNGFSGHAQYCNDEVANSNGDAFGAQVNYSNGPLYVTGSYDQVNTDFNADGVLRTEAFKAAASYTFAETFTISGIYERIDFEDNDADLDGNRDAFYVAGSYKLANNVLKVAYSHANDLDSDNGEADDTGADYIAVGADHNFSKRTKVYALYARTENEDNAIYGLGSPNNPNLTSSGSTFANDIGETVDVFAVGVKHDF